MESKEAYNLFLKNSSAMAYVDVKLPNGNRDIGSAFHIGDGVFLTARHVVDKNKIIEVKLSEPVAITSKEMFPDIAPETLERNDAALKEAIGFTPMYKHFTDALEITEGPYFLDDDQIDLAVFKVKEVHSGAASIDLGFHYDDFIHRSPFILSDAIVLGYPPIPMTNEPHLVAAKAQIHTFVNLRSSPFIHFILSAIPRGGFSGGVAIHEGGFALGVITSGLVENHASAETGFFAVVSVEPIHKLLEERNLVPRKQKENWQKVINRHKKFGR